MRVNPFSSSRYRVAPEPHGPASPDTPTSKASTSPKHALSQAPKSAAAQGVSKSQRGMLASARKSLTLLRKQLSLTCMGSPTLETAESPSPRTTPMSPNAMPGRTKQMQGRQDRVDERFQSPIPETMRRDKEQPPPQRMPASHSMPITPKPSSAPSSALPPNRQPSLRSLDRELAEITQHCHAIRNQLLQEGRRATPHERQLLDKRQALIAQRKEVSDSQLNAMLVALAPMEDIRAPRATTSGHSRVQMDVMQHNRRELRKIREKFSDKEERSVVDRNYARAQRRLESLKKGNAPHDQIARLERMMQGYENMLALERMAESTDNQLEQAPPTRHSLAIPPKPAPMPSPAPQLSRQRSLRSLDRQLLEINQHCRAVKNQLLKERRKATPEEQQLLVEFATLIAERNEVRKSQLDALLVGLAPMQDIRAPRTTTSGYSMVQGDVMQHNRRELIKLRQMFADNKIERSVLDANYALAERRLESLKKGNTDDHQIERLERMMHGYQNMLALEQIVKSTDDQLERLGAPRLMASIPTTAEERRQALEKERDAHQEALDNGYY